LQWKTRITELLGCEYPIIQGAFGGFGTSALAAPVSAARGFGIITAGALHTPEKLRQDITKARSMTDSPFGVNLSIGICPHIDEMREVAIEEKVPVIFTAAYRADDHGKRVQQAGLKWIHKVATIEHALAAERQGADAVVIVGLEGAGFKNITQLPTLITITTAVRLLRIPVIAAGGIGDAHGFLAALGMGAEGIYMGTRFMATKECPISDRYKQALVAAQPWDPEYRDRALLPPRREEYQRVMREKGSLPMDQWLQKLEMVFLQETAGTTPIDWEKAYQEWEPEAALRLSGGSLAVGVIDEVITVKELIDSIIGEAEEILSRAGGIN
jgi:NAD(P)H-dependent flavin oxidoreductase YrpB (nitropropane dioxygenase family)